MPKANLPGFTAGASLYPAGRYFRTPRAAKNILEPMNTVHPELMSQGGEMINVHDCPPGFLGLGEGENLTCISDPTIGNGGGVPGGGAGGVPFGGGDGGGSGASGYKPTEGGTCHAESGYNRVNSGKYKYSAGDWECCGAKMSNGSQFCLGCQTDKKGNSSICKNGKAPQ